MSQVQIHATAPYFLVPDVRLAAAYYRDVLGFSYDRLWGTPPSFCMVQRDQFVIMLRQTSNRAAILPNELFVHESWDAYFWIHDAESLFIEFHTQGAHFVYPPTVRDYGMKEFALRDLNGYVLAFGQQIPTTSL